MIEIGCTCQTIVAGNVVESAIGIWLQILDGELFVGSRPTSTVGRGSLVARRVSALDAVSIVATNEQSVAVMRVWPVRAKARDRASTARRLGAVGLLVGVGGCATGYDRANLACGYESLCLQDDLYQVSFQGNGYTSHGRATDFALLRAAELALEKGCPYFVVVEKETRSEASARTMPMVAQTSGNVESFGSLSATTTVSGGETYAVSKPSSDMLIRVLEERPDAGAAIVYDAAQIQRNLRAKYGIKPPNDQPAPVGR